MISSQREMLAWTFTLTVLIGQLNNHMIKSFAYFVFYRGWLDSSKNHMLTSFAYFTNSQCLLCNRHHEARFTKYDRCHLSPKIVDKLMKALMVRILLWMISISFALTSMLPSGHKLGFLWYTCQTKKRYHVIKVTPEWCVKFERERSCNGPKWH